MGNIVQKFIKVFFVSNGYPTFINRKSDVSSTFEYFLAFFCRSLGIHLTHSTPKGSAKIHKTGPKGSWAQMTSNRPDFGANFVQKLMKFFLCFQWSPNFYYSRETCLKLPRIFSCTFLRRLGFHVRHSTQKGRQQYAKPAQKGTGLR